MDFQENLLNKLYLYSSYNLCIVTKASQIYENNFINQDHVTLIFKAIPVPFIVNLLTIFLLLYAQFPVERLI